MLTTLELENYRGFRQYGLKDLARVNLLVGKNNCGKTSVLEAVQLLVSGGDPGVLTGIASQRGEVVFGLEGQEDSRRQTYPSLVHFFHGHEFGPGASFTVRSDDEITVRVVDLRDLPNSRQERPVFEQMLRSAFQEEAGLDISLGICFDGSAFPVPQRPLTLPVTEEGAIPSHAFQGYRRLLPKDHLEAPPVQYVSPDPIEPRSMSDMWNRVISEGRESEVIDHMRILDPRLKDVYFLSGETAYRFGRRGGVLAAFEGSRRRDPLGSCGEGMRRLLALSLSLIQSGSGVLLVDEIDTGLHYSIMGDMWRLVTEAARRSGVQVFATTHSSDCVRGLAWLCENHPDLAGEVSLQKIDPDLEQAVALDAEKIMLATNQGMEVR
jgi:predicted ATPase